MNIVYASRELHPSTGGDAAAYIHHTSALLARCGHRVFLVTDRVIGRNEKLLPPGVEMIETEASPPRQAGCFFSENQEYSCRVLNTLRDLARKEKLDVVEFADCGAEGFATIRAKRLLNEFEGTKLIVKGQTPLSLRFQIKEVKTVQASRYCDFEMEDYCLRHADVVTAPSLALAKYFQERVGRIDIHVAPDAICLSPGGSGRKFNVEPVKTIRFIGPVEAESGADVFVEAALRILEADAGFRFEIHGSDPGAGLFGKSYSRLLASRIPERFKSRIAFTGLPAPGALSSLLSNSCFCVLPSRWENWPRLCLEAMSQGCVVIASSRGGMPEMIQHGQDGFLINPQHPEEIADLILRQHQDLGRLEQISAAAQARSRDLSDPEKVKARLLELYTQPLPRRPWLRPAAKRVSVIIPYYNHGQYLAEAIQSARASGYPNLEIIVVNDGSTDASAQEVFERTEGVVKVRKENGGLSSARNAGIRVATGDYLLMLDADDKIHADYIPTAVEALENNPDLAYVASHAQCFGVFDRPWMPVGFVPALMGFMNTAGTCAIVARREVFAACGGYDERMISYEDWDFLLTVYEHGLEGDVLPAEYLYYRQHFDSMQWTVANPRRAELIQYMMLKHAAGLPKDRWAMAVALAGLWKGEEIRAEALVQRQIELERRLDEQERSFEAALNHATAGELPPGWLSRFFEKALGRKLRSSIRKRITGVRSLFEDQDGGPR